MDEEVFFDTKLPCVKPGWIYDQSKDKIIRNLFLANRNTPIQWDYHSCIKRAARKLAPCSKIDFERVESNYFIFKFSGKYLNVLASYDAVTIGTVTKVNYEREVCIKVYSSERSLYTSCEKYLKKLIDGSPAKFGLSDVGVRNTQIPVKCVIILGFGNEDYKTFDSVKVCFTKVKNILENMKSFKYFNVRSFEVAVRRVGLKQSDGSKRLVSRINNFSDNPTISSPLQELQNFHDRKLGCKQSWDIKFDVNSTNIKNSNLSIWKDEPILDCKESRNHCKFNAKYSCENNLISKRSKRVPNKTPRVILCKNSCTAPYKAPSDKILAKIPRRIPCTSPRKLVINNLDKKSSPDLKMSSFHVGLNDRNSTDQRSFHIGLNSVDKISSVPSAFGSRSSGLDFYTRRTNNNHKIFKNCVKQNRGSTSKLRTPINSNEVAKASSLQEHSDSHARRCSTFQQLRTAVTSTGYSNVKRKVLSKQFAGIDPRNSMIKNRSSEISRHIADKSKSYYINQVKKSDDSTIYAPNGLTDKIESVVEKKCLLIEEIVKNGDTSVLKKTQEPMKGDSVLGINHGGKKVSNKEDKMNLSIVEKVNNIPIINGSKSRNKLFLEAAHCGQSNLNYYGSKESDGKKIFIVDGQRKTDKITIYSISPEDYSISISIVDSSTLIFPLRQETDDKVKLVKYFFDLNQYPKLKIDLFCSVLKSRVVNHVAFENVIVKYFESEYFNDNFLVLESSAGNEPTTTGFISYVLECAFKTTSFAQFFKSLIKKDRKVLIKTDKFSWKTGILSWEECLKHRRNFKFLFDYSIMLRNRDSGNFGSAVNWRFQCLSFLNFYINASKNILVSDLESSPKSFVSIAVTEKAKQVALSGAPKSLTFDKVKNITDFILPETRSNSHVSVTDVCSVAARKFESTSLSPSTVSQNGISDQKQSMLECFVPHVISKDSAASKMFGINLNGSNFGSLLTSEESFNNLEPLNGESKALTIGMESLIDAHVTFVESLSHHSIPVDSRRIFNNCYKPCDPAPSDVECDRPGIMELCDIGGYISPQLWVNLKESSTNKFPKIGIYKMCKGGSTDKINILLENWKVQYELKDKANMRARRVSELSLDPNTNDVEQKRWLDLLYDGFKKFIQVLIYLFQSSGNEDF